ncbi:hypothetical protein GKC56_08590 [Neisseriaceae bacterium PsAf]|nr:hypothetical protein [Neisseriaceae bacterium PsAf]
MVREGVYTEYKGKEYKIYQDKKDGQYYIFFGKGKVSSELEEFGYKEGFVEELNFNPNYPKHTGIYRLPVTPSEVGKVYSIRTYAKYKGRDLYVSRERE